jgi:hypothetical protein
LLAAMEVPLLARIWEPAVRALRTDARLFPLRKSDGSLVDIQNLDQL